MWGATAAGPGFGWTPTPVTQNPVVPTAPPAASPVSPFSAYGSNGVSWQLPTPGALLAMVAARRGQFNGPATDTEIEDFLYDALEFLPGTTDVEVRCEGGRVTLSGTVPNKRQKHDVGELAWAIPTLADVNNTVTIANRRRSRASVRDNESGQARKHG
jgi:hypothetical protein